MSWIHALILGFIQGLTEFIPVSSSGHLELGAHFLNIQETDSLTFSLTVHAATVLSTIVVFRKDILKIIVGSIRFQQNVESRYVSLLLFSAVPIAIMGFFFKEDIESLFTGNLILVGSSLLVTALLLAFAHYKKGEQKGTIGFKDSLIIGISQALAVVPGISRSGATIATGILLGNRREDVARFSFLMVLIPIIGAFLLGLLHGNFTDDTKIGFLPLIVGFLTAFITGMFACKLMIRLVTQGNLIYFALYCLIIALIAIFAG